MKTTLITSLLVFLFLSFPSTVYNTYLAVGEKTYCMGWQSGYISGYCYNDPFCIEPIVPICGIPRVNFNKYKDGVADGFLAGRKKRKAEDNP
jgi:hypothetical protein